MSMDERFGRGGSSEVTFFRRSRARARARSRERSKPVAVIGLKRKKKTYAQTRHGETTVFDGGVTCNTKTAVR